MALPTTVVAISASTNVTDSGTADLTAIASNVSAQVITTGGRRPICSFQGSTDGVFYTTMVPTSRQGTWFYFAMPVRYVKAMIANNTGTCTVNIAGTA
jgi:hypothetical protein